MTVEAPGSVAVHGQRLAALVARFPGDAMVTLTAEGAAAGVACGRSRFKLPIIPLDDMPAPLAVAEETGRLELSRADAIRALDAPLVAVGNELSRYYLMGVYLHAADGALAAVATDGHQLVRCRFPGVDGFTTGLILPRAAVKIVLKLLADKAIERVTLRRSLSLCAIEGPRFVFTSKLIDGTFPDYQRVIPQPSSNAVIVDRGALLQALGRLGAVADDNLPEIVGLQWSAGESALRLCLTRQADLADDVVDAEVSGAGRIATSLEQLSELIDGLAGERVRLDAGEPSRPLLITDLGRRKFVGAGHSLRLVEP